METLEYFKNNQMAADLFHKKYCHVKEDGTKENVSEAFHRVAAGLASMEGDNELADYWHNRWYKDLMDGWYRPGGSILSGVGNSYKVSLANCTTIPLEGDSIESINKCAGEMMRCAARRQGLGVDVSNLRPAGAKVNNAANESTGVVPWMDYLQIMGNYVGQRGRIPACLISLKVHHPDIFKFIEAKEISDKINNANISVQVSDAFMEAVEKDKDWKLFFETKHEKIEKVVKARDLFDHIAKYACETAEPGVQYIDKMREGSMIHQIYKHTGKEKYKLISTNACSEKGLAPYSNCDLGSLNMGMFPTSPKEYKPILFEKAEALVRLLDNAIEYELVHKLSPIDKQLEITRLVREIGCGVTNLHEWLMNQDLQYDSDDGISAIEEFMYWYAYYVLESSQNLAEEKGPAPAYEEEGIDNLVLRGSTFFKNMCLAEPTVYQRKLRNLALMSIAPGGSISSTFRLSTISTGIEPMMAPYWWKATRAIQHSEYDYYFCLPGRVKEYVLSRMDDGKDKDFLKSIGETVHDNDGEIGEKVQYIIDKHLGEGFFKCCHEIDPMKKIELMSGVYKWVDSAISCTYNLPSDATPEIVRDIYMEGWKRGVRAISVYRDGSREGIVLFDSPKHVDKEEHVYCQDRPEKITFTCAPKRPEELPCDIHRCKIQGNDWLVIVGIKDGYPYELFAGEYDKDEMYVPLTVKEGVTKKCSGGRYSLIIPVRGTEVEYKDIARTFMNVRYRSMTRMISLGLRHGIRPVYVIDQMKKSNEDITEFSSVVSRVLNKYMKNLDYTYLNGKNKDICACGESSWTNMGGCKTCAVCGRQKCD